jgi:hypothetical protein
MFGGGGELEADGVVKFFESRLTGYLALSLVTIVTQLPKLKYLVSKDIPLAGHGSLYGYEMLRIPHCLDNRLTDGGKIVSLTHRPLSTPQKHFSASGTHFC